MNTLEKEQYKEWLEFARSLETDLALKKLKSTNDINKVLEEFSCRFINKALDPLIRYINLTTTSSYNPNVSRSEYYEYYELKNLKPKPDHIQE